MSKVAEALGIPESQARELGRKGELPTVRIGKYVRVRKGDLDSWVATHRENRADQTANHGYTMYQGYSSRRGRTRVPTSSQGDGLQPSQARRSYGHHRNQRGAVGARRTTDQRVGVPVPAAPDDHPAHDED
jgi:excisionase family DNA binding protein